MKAVKLLTGFLVTLVFFVVASGSGTGQDREYALKGSLLTPDGVIEDGTILISGEKIRAIGAGIPVPVGATVVDTGGVILPGFVDLHNHLTWNVLPRWKPNQTSANRYEWQQLSMYGISLSTPHEQLLKGNLGCAMNRYAEVKAITEGETSVVGSLGKDACIEGLARNLDFYSGFYQPGLLGNEKLRNEVFPLELDSAVAAGINDALEKKELTAFIVHLAEGKPNDASAAREFRMFAARGFLRPGVSIIHGTALKEADFQEMAMKGVGLIWAPRSNLELYGATTDVRAAKREHVKMALSPDWSPTASDGMLEELKFAAAWNSGQAPPVFTSMEMVRMATEYPAELAGLGDRIGALAPGYYADLLVLKRTQRDAYDSVVHASPVDVDLVIIDGTPVYGAPEAIGKLLPHQNPVTLTVCRDRKAIYFDTESRVQGTTPQSWEQTTNDLRSALRAWGSDLAPLADCGN